MAQVFVVDQNYLRSEELKALAAEPGYKFVILDEAMIEMCKTAEWEDTLRHSLHTLALRPSRVVVGRSMSELLRWERDHMRSASGHLLSAEGTRFLRDILEGIRSGAESRSLDAMRQNIKEAQRDMEKIHFDHDENKRNLVELVETAEASAPRLAAALRKNKLPRDERLQHIKGLAMQLGHSFIARGGLTAVQARRLVRQRSCWLRFGMVRLWYAFDWLHRLRVEGIDPPKATNEKMDYRYIVPGTFFTGGLLTRETQMNRCFADMVELLRRWDRL